MLGHVSGEALDGAELGLKVFKSVVSQSILDEMNAAIDATRSQWLAAHGGPGLPVANACAQLLRGSAMFRSIEQRACSETQAWVSKESRRAVAHDSLASLRCVNSTMSWQSHLRHFDSHLLTLLIPLQAAQDVEPNGDLLLYVKRRKFAPGLRNLVHKVWLVLQQNRSIGVRERHTTADLAAGRCRRIACTPGHVYAFNGFAAMHANLHVASGERRTLVFQYFDTNSTAGIKRVTPTLNRWRERIGRWVGAID